MKTQEQIEEKEKELEEQLKIETISPTEKYDIEIQLLILSWILADED